MRASIPILRSGSGVHFAEHAWIGVSGDTTSPDRWAPPCCPEYAFSVGQSPTGHRGSFDSPPMVNVNSEIWSMRKRTDCRPFQVIRDLLRILAEMTVLLAGTSPA